MSFVKDNASYEAWLARHCDVVKKDIRHKHKKKMTESAFSFLRATYFRWASKIGSWCPELMDAPDVLAVGDLHLENFGTWRDADGRLVWGVNDFDEAATMPYTLDLVRLVTSIQLAPQLHRDVTHQAAANAVLRGYREGLKGPQPALLFEGETFLWSYALPDQGEPEDFWQEVQDYPKAKPPQRIARALVDSLPKGVDKNTIRLCTRRKGGGSLGRPRYVAVGYWRGGHVLREAKALVPSAWAWAHGRGKSQKSNFLKLAKGQYRAPDPQLHVRHKFVFRRIAGDAEKIEIEKKTGADIHLKHLQAMGFDLASVHAASGNVGAIRKNVDKRRAWLVEHRRDHGRRGSAARLSGVEEIHEGALNHPVISHPAGFVAILSAEPAVQRPTRRGSSGRT